MLRFKGGSKELKELLTFMEHTTQSNAVDEELQEIQKIVTRIKSQADVKERYMTLQEVIDYEKRDSYEEGVDVGRELGLTEGMKLGRSEGISLGIIQGTISTCKLLNRNKSQTKAHLMCHFHLTEDKADEYIDLHW